MEISHIKITPFQSEMSLVCAFVELEFDHELVVRDITIKDAGNGPFVAWPDRRTKHGQYAKVVSFKKAEIFNAVEKLIIDTWIFKKEN